MSEGTEYRRLVVTGELAPEDWEAAVSLLGDLGLSAMQRKEKEPQYVPAPELFESEGLGVTAEYGDIVDFALANGKTKSAAGRVWGLLTRAYDHAIYGDYYSQFAWYTESDRETPIRFAGPKPMETSWEGHGVWLRNLHGLSIDSVVSLLGELDVATERMRNENDAIRAVFGKQAGPVVVDFLRRFVASTQERSSDQHA